MNPPYELAFHAQIFQALAYNKGDTKSIRKKLKAMLRDDKHIDHFDMIHYALADLDLKERKDSSAIDHLETSVHVSTTDTKQKAKSFLKLADIYFEDRDYVPAQQYYDSTRSLLNEAHARYEEVDTRARVLGDLVEQLAIIEREDSLQKLMGLDPEAAFQARMKEKDVQLVDVRTAGEFDKGYIAGAVNNDWLEDGFLERAKALDKSKPVLLYCAAGGRSEEAMAAMKKAGFANVTDLRDGFNGWKRSNMPVAVK